MHLRVKEILGLISPENPIESRLKTINAYCDAIKSINIDDEYQLRVCWNAMTDMLSSKKTYPAAFKVMLSIVEGHYPRLGVILRMEFFGVIKDAPMEISSKCIALELLTNKGRDIVPFDIDITFLLISWLDQYPSFSIYILNIIGMIIKYNTHVLTDHDGYLVNSICERSDHTDLEYLMEIINIYDIIVC